MFTLDKEYSFTSKYNLPDCKFDFLVIKNNTIILPVLYSWNGCNVVPDFKGTYYASAVHDALYQYHAVSKHVADKIFYEIMKNEKFVLAELYYLGVVLFGRHAYNEI